MKNRSELNPEMTGNIIRSLRERLGASCEDVESALDRSGLGLSITAATIHRAEIGKPVTNITYTRIFKGLSQYAKQTGQNFNFNAYNGATDICANIDSILAGIAERSEELDLAAWKRAIRRPRGRQHSKD